MSENKIETRYVCPVCHTSYDRERIAEMCLRSHDDETGYIEMWLFNFYGDGSFKYKFECYRYLRKYDWPKPDTNVTRQDGYEYPKFITNCLDTEQEILAAKRRLIQAAREWADGYKKVLANLERELEM